MAPVFNRWSFSQRRPGWKSTLILTVLALLANVVFLVQFLGETSLISAIAGVEYARLMPPGKGEPHVKRGPTWNTLYDELRTKTSNEPYAARHVAVAQLLRAVVDVERRRGSAIEIIAVARQVSAKDPDNWVSRLALASLEDATLSEAAPAYRFDAIQRIIEQPTEPSVSTLYNKEYGQAWEEILTKYVKRLDVMSNLAAWMDHGEIKDHYAALPMIQRRLSGLASALADAGDQRSADKCRKWIVETGLGLMESDTDAGTRLLCADFVARALPAGDPVAHALRSVRESFHKRAADAPPDLTSHSRAPALFAGLWYLVLGWNLMAAALFIMGAGAALTLTLASGAGLLWRPRLTGVEEPAPNRRGRTLWRRFALIALFAIIGAFTGNWLARHLYSEACLYVWALGVLGIGSLSPFVVAWASADYPIAPLRCSLVLVAVVIFAFVSLASGPPLARILQAMGPRGGAVVLLSASTVAVISACLYSHRRSLHGIARSAAVTWCALSIVATAAQANTVFADGDWKLMVATGNRDPFSARLGHDWWDRYNLPRPNQGRQAGATIAP